MNVPARQLGTGRTLDEWLTALGREREVIALEPGERGDYHLARSDGWQPGRFTLGPYRPVDPLKIVLCPPRQSLGPLFPEDPPHPRRQRLVVGVKNCDLAGLEIQDHVFTGLAPADPGYAAARASTILVSCDCTDIRDTCFCPVLGVQPYAETRFDINLSPVSGQVLVEAGSQQGERLLNETSDCLAPADVETVKARDEQRAAIRRRLLEQAAGHGLQPDTDLTRAIRAASDSPLWDDFAADCVECGACNYVCCSCHCFLLADGALAGGAPGRDRQWDSCLLMNFARVAGGGNPRAGRAERLHNRFDKKFSYFPDVLGVYGCDGCGRCTEACPGTIDIRAVLKRAVDEQPTLCACPGNH